MHPTARTHYPHPILTPNIHEYLTINALLHALTHHPEESLNTLFTHDSNLTPHSSLAPVPVLPCTCGTILSLRSRAKIHKCDPSHGKQKKISTAMAPRPAAFSPPMIAVDHNSPSPYRTVARQYSLAPVVCVLATPSPTAGEICFMRSFPRPYPSHTTHRNEAR